MSHQRVPPPQDEACLSRPCLLSRNQKGGTLIAQDVLDLQTHRKRLAEPDDYRPSHCPGCGHAVLHVHDYRTRRCQLLGVPTVTIVRYRCASCSAGWQVLPAFIPRHLWFHWPLVQLECQVGDNEDQRTVAPQGQRPSRTTVARWLMRLLSSGRILAQLLATSAEATLVAVACKLGLGPTRRHVADELGRPLSEIAALMHQLMPNVRLM